MGIEYIEREVFIQTALSKMKSSNVVLDIGTGIAPREYIKSNFYICCEPFIQYIDELKKNIAKKDEGVEYLVLNCDWASVLKMMPDKSVDTIFIIDVIEHLEKDEGAQLLRDTIRLARKQVVLFTPLGYLAQHLHPDGKDAWGLDGADWQEHKSGWLPEDFDGSWDLLICKDYHLNDNLGNPYEVPAGAFWAIKNIEDQSGTSTEKILLKMEQYLDLNKKIESIPLLQSQIGQLEGQISKLEERINKLYSNVFVKVARYILRFLRF